MKNYYTRYISLLFCLVVLFHTPALAQSNSQTKLRIDWNQIPLPDGVFSSGLAWSPDSKYLAFADIQLKQLSLLEIQTQRILRQINIPDWKDDHSPFSVVWSPDGISLAFAVWGNAYVIDTTTDKVAKMFSVPSDKGDILDIRWSHDSSLFAALSDRGYIYIFDVSEGRIDHVIDLHEKGKTNGGYSFFDWNSDSTLFAAHYFGTYVIGVWDDTGNLISGDGQEQDQQPSKKPCRSGLDAGPGYIHNIEWSRDGKKLLIAGSTLGICSFENEHLVADNGISYIFHDVIENVVPIFPATWSPDGHWIAGSLSSSSEFCEVQIFDAVNDYQVNRIDYFPQNCEAIAWSSDGKYIALQGTQNLWIGTVVDS